MSALPQPPPHEPSDDRDRRLSLERRPLRRRRALWKRILIWTGAALALLIILVVVTIAVLLHSARFHRYVLRRAQEQATAALGSQVQFRDYALHWSGMSPALDLYDIRVSGAPPYPNPPLLTADHLGMRITITSLLRHSFYVDDITVNHPVVHVFVDKKGANNLPQSNKKSSSQSQTNVFDLGIRHALLDGGEVDYNDRKSALDADLHDVTFRAAFDAAQQTYTGSLSYRNGRVKMQPWNPLMHDFNADFTANRQTFTLQRAVLAAGPSQIVLTARMDDYVQPRVQATYDATVDAGQFRKIMKDPSLPTGVLHATGNLQYASMPAGSPSIPLLAALVLNGDLSSQALAVNANGMKTEIRNLGARYSVAKGNAEVRDMRASLFGGEFTGALSMRDLTGATHSELRAALRNLSLAELKAAMPNSMQNVALSGTVSATARAAWGKSIDNLVAHSDATIQASAAPAQGGAALPVNGAIHADYRAAGQQITLTNSFLRTPQTSLQLNGTVSQHSALAVRLQANDLHELETVADGFRNAANGQPVSPMGLHGIASFNGNVTGSTSAPHLTGQLMATNLQVHGSSWKLLRTNVDVSPSSAALQNGELDPADRGRMTFGLRTGLNHWAFSERSPIQVTFNASQINIASLMRLAGSTASVTGTLAANVAIAGTELDPTGHGNVTLSNAKISGEPVQSLAVNFTGNGNEVHADLNLRLPAAAAAEATLIYLPKLQNYDAQLHADNIRLDQLETIKQRNIDLHGVLNLDASGRGNIHNPALDAKLAIPQLQMHEQTISGLTLTANIANHLANFVLDSQVVSTYARARGSIKLADDYFADATFDTGSIPFAPLVTAYAPTQAGNINGQTELHGTLRGPLRDQKKLDAHLVIPQLAINYKNTVQLAAAAPIRVDYTGGTLQLQRSAIRGTGTDLQFQGTVPLANPNAPVSLLLQGTMDLKLAELLDPDITSAGQLRFNINSYGQRANPDVQGQVQVVNASFATGDMPLGVQNGNGVLTLTKDRLNITSFQANVGGGTLKASGGVSYRPGLYFDLALAGNDIRVLYPDNVRSVSDLNLALTGTTDSALLRGNIRINQLSFTPDFDVSDLMASAGTDTTPPPAQGFGQNLQLDIGVASTTGINLVAKQLSIAGAANLRVAGSAAQPVILGRVNLNGGDIILMGNQYVLQGGTIDFVNPTRTTPVLNVSASTTIQQYNIQLRFWGPADHLHTNYASDPALPPADIINLIAKGKTTEAEEANPTPAMLGAESAIASQVSGQVTNRLEKAAGISGITIDPELGGNGENPGARVGIQQHITSKDMLTFSTDVTGTQRAAIKLEHQISPRVSVTTVRDQNGGVGVDVKIKKSW
jgi:translocation and assembly module TamB